MTGLLRILFIGLFIASCSNDTETKFSRTGGAVKSDPGSEDAKGKSGTEVKASSTKTTVEDEDEDDSGTSEETIAEDEKPKEVVGPKFAISDAIPVSQDLGTSADYKYTITPAEGYSGPAVFSIDKTDLAAFDTKSGTTIAISPISLDLVSGTAQDIIVTVTTTSMSKVIAADATAGHFKLIGSTGSETIEQDIGLVINPLFVIEMRGGGANPQTFKPDFDTINFVEQDTDLTIRWVNMDTDADNVIHGNGDIMHGPTGNPMAISADGVAPGGPYDVTIAPGDTGGSFYSHKYEGGGDRRTMNFNQQ